MLTPTKGKMKNKTNEIRTSPRCRGRGFDIKCLQCNGDAQIVYYEHVPPREMIRGVKIQCKKCKNSLIIF